MSNDILKEFEKEIRCKDNVSSTIYRKLFQLNSFLLWIERQGKKIAGIQQKDIQEYLLRFRKRDTRIQNLHAIKVYLELCIESGLISENPALEIKYKRERTQKVYDIPSFEEIQKATDRIRNTNTLIALRDFILIEISYGSGLRAGELFLLDIEDIDLTEKIILAKGKGRGEKKERLIPLTDITCNAIKIYLKKRNAVSGALFVSYRNKRLSDSSIYSRFKKWTKRNPHSFRHAFASDLLENGCKFEDISEMLGHTRPSTTAIYTHIPIKNLKEKINTFHPRNVSKSNAKSNEKSFT